MKFFRVRYIGVSNFQNPGGIETTWKKNHLRRENSQHVGSHGTHSHMDRCSINWSTCICSLGLASQFGCDKRLSNWDWEANRRTSLLAWLEAWKIFQPPQNSSPKMMYIRRRGVCGIPSNLPALNSRCARVKLQNHGSQKFQRLRIRLHQSLSTELRYSLLMYSDCLITSPRCLIRYERPRNIKITYFHSFFQPLIILKLKSSHRTQSKIFYQSKLLLF